MHRVGVAEDLLAEVALDLLRERVAGAEVAEEVGTLGEKAELAAVPSRPP